MNKSPLKVILNKELKRVFTDKRLIFTVFILPAISIFVVYVLLGFVLADSINDDIEERSNVIVNNAPESLKGFLEKENNEFIDILYTEGIDPKIYAEDIKNGDIELLVSFHKNFNREVENYIEKEGLPLVNYYYNLGEDLSNDTRRVFNDDILSRYEDTIIVERFGDLSYIKAFNLVNESDSIDSANQDKATGSMLAQMLPMLISVFLFAGAMSVGIDSIAGEKERGTLATMLMTPVKREVIVVGKILSLSIISLISALSSIIGIIMSLIVGYTIAFSGDAGSFNDLLNFGYSVIDLLMLLAIILVMVGTYVSIVCLISIFSKSVKEAGTYISPIYMGITIVGIATMLNDSVESSFMHLLPIYSQVISIKEILIYEMTGLNFGLTMMSSLITILILVRVIRRMFNDEKYLFSHS